MSQRTPSEPRWFHCECHVDERRSGILDAHSTAEALRWFKATLMMVAISMDEEPYRQARDWIEHGQTEATPRPVAGPAPHAHAEAGHDARDVDSHASALLPTAEADRHQRVNPCATTFSTA